MNDTRLTDGLYEMRLIGPEPALRRLWAYQTTVVRADSPGNMEFRAIQALCAKIDVEYDELPEECAPFEFAEPVLTANMWRNPDGSQQWFVAVFAAGRGKGGPEEGGWWFDTGELVQQTAVASRAEAEALREALREQFPDTGRRSSVLGGEDYDIAVNLTPFPQGFPESTPRYE